MNFVRPNAVICSVTLVAALFFASSATAGLPSKMYHSRVWQAQDGLPQDAVQALAQTADGYLWIGTSGGLIRFDGDRFIIFTRDNTPALRDDSVWSLTASRDGTLWVGTEGGGLLRYRSGEFHLFGVEDGLTNGFIRTIFEDSHSALWVGTDRGLFRLSGEKFVRIDDRSNFHEVNVYAIGEDSDGRIFVGCTESDSRTSGLMVLSGDHATFHTSAASEADSRVDAIQVARNGALWLGTFARVRRVTPHHDGNPFVRDTLVQAISNDGRPILSREVVTGAHVSAMAESRDGSVWIGTYGKGLFQFQNGNIREFKAPGFLPDNNVQAIIEDSEGSIWVGTQNGLVRLNQSLAETVKTKDGAPVNISTVYEDSTGKVWMASLGGQLFRVSGRILVPASISPKISELSVRTVFRDRAGDFWIGTAGQGAIQISKTGLRRFTSKEGLVNPFIRAFCEDRDGSLWIGTDGGLSHFHERRFQTFVSEDGLTHGSIRSMLQDRHGDLWVGTEKGVTHFHAGRVTFEPVLEAMREEKVWAMYEDRNGGMWFGTRGGGLFLLSKGKVTKYTTAQGLPSNNIFSIVEDAHAALWMSSSTGLFSIDRKELERGASDGHSHIAIRIYGRSEGLGTKQMNGGVQPAGIMTKSGELWFASSSGAVRMRPADLPIEKPAPVFVEQVLADGQELPRSGRVVLGPGHEKIEIHYSAISLRSPERIRFRYRLEGFEQNWADVGDRRVAYYTNLPAGDFRFRVIAYDVSVPEQLSEAGIEIRLNPRFYMTVWFGVLSLFALVSLAGSIYILHMRRIRQQFAAVVQERGRLAREMHDTLIQGCVGVSTLLEAASVVQDSSPPAGRDLLDRARAQIQLTVEEARRAVWNLRHESESAASLLATLSQLAHHAGAESGITVTFEHSGSPMPIGNDVHHNIVLIAREALHNAMRHAAPRHVSMVLSFQDQSLGLHVVDDGCGFDGLESVDGRHYGLAGMRERATSIGGQFRITARSGQGTTVQVQVPLN